MPKVMLVEDDNNLREIYDARLVAEGYEIVSAHDGEEALALAVKERPDLIISDVMMPKISGFDMLDILRATPETKNTKVIMMTALGQAEDRSRAEKLGADRYLVKSQVTLEDVIKVAHEVLGDISASATDTVSTAASPTPVDVPVVAAPPVATPPAEPVAAKPEEPVLVEPPVGLTAAGAAATPPTSSPAPTPTPATEPPAATTPAPAPAPAAPLETPTPSAPAVPEPAEPVVVPPTPPVPATTQPAAPQAETEPINNDLTKPEPKKPTASKSKFKTLSPAILS
jgi:CheY-like chemotaxis protein